jgi:arsenical pump membrane protein
MNFHGLETIPPANAATWIIATATIGAVLSRPANLPEAWWAAAGAILLVLGGLLPWPSAWQAVGKGLDVYLFLAGMMLLSELARREGVFDWCAALAVGHSRGSPVRLFTLVYGVGVLITIFLSNDATAVVLTPAVLAVTRAAKVSKPLPYLLACALVANAASFVLPISNPANLVLFARQIPPLAAWLSIFALPSAVSIVATGAILLFLTRRDLVDRIVVPSEKTPLSTTGKLALASIASAVLVLLGASAFHLDLGAPTCAVGVLAWLLVSSQDRKAFWETPRDVSWSVLPLVAGLFVVVEAVNATGVLEATTKALAELGKLPPWQGNLAAAFGITAISNLINNLPSGLIAGTAVAQAPVADTLRNALLIGVDLGPNLSVTGSLATILWLIALRRENQAVGAWTFLKIGVVATPFALLLAILASTFLHPAS